MPMPTQTSIRSSIDVVHGKRISTDLILKQQQQQQQQQQQLKTSDLPSIRKRPSVDGGVFKSSQQPRHVTHQHQQQHQHRQQHQQHQQHHQQQLFPSLKRSVAGTSVAAALPPYARPRPLASSFPSPHTSSTMHHPFRLDGGGRRIMNQANSNTVALLQRRLPLPTLPHTNNKLLNHSTLSHHALTRTTSAALVPSRPPSASVRHRQIGVSVPPPPQPPPPQDIDAPRKRMRTEGLPLAEKGMSIRL